MRGLTPLQMAWKELEEFAARLAGPRPRWHKRVAFADAVERILAARGAARWVSNEVVTVDEAIFRQEKRERPGKDTRRRRRLKRRFRLTWQLREAAIAADARAEDLFPLLTNRQDLTAAKSSMPTSPSSRSGSNGTTC